MEKIEIAKAEAIAEYQNGDASVRKSLLRLCGGKRLDIDITDMVKSFEDACAIEGVDPLQILPYRNPRNGDEDALNATMEMIIITRALNEKYVPNWRDINERKWYPVFDLSAGFGFSFSGYGLSLTYSGLGSRLCYKTEKLSDYSGKQFLAIHERIQIIKP